jgi:hypothetical protein
MVDAAGDVDDERSHWTPGMRERRILLWMYLMYDETALHPTQGKLSFLGCSAVPSWRPSLTHSLENGTGSLLFPTDS